MADKGRLSRIKIGNDWMNIDIPTASGNYTFTTYDEGYRKINLKFMSDTGSTTVSVPTNTNVDISFTNFSRPYDQAVVWISAQVTFTANASGTRSIYLYKEFHDGASSSIEIGLAAQQRLPATPNGATIITSTAHTFMTRHYDTPNAGGDLNCRIWQNSGTTLSATVNYVCIYLEK